MSGDESTSRNVLNLHNSTRAEATDLSTEHSILEGIVNFSETEPQIDETSETNVDGSVTTTRPGPDLFLGSETTLQAVVTPFFEVTTQVSTESTNREATRAPEETTEAAVAYETTHVVGATTSREEEETTRASVINIDGFEATEDFEKTTQSFLEAIQNSDEIKEISKETLLSAELTTASKDETSRFILEQTTLEPETIFETENPKIATRNPEEASENLKIISETSESENFAIASENLEIASEITDYTTENTKNMLEPVSRDDLTKEIRNQEDDISNEINPTSGATEDLNSATTEFNRATENHGRLRSGVLNIIEKKNPRKIVIRKTSKGKGLSFLIFSEYVCVVLSASFSLELFALFWHAAGLLFRRASITDPVRFLPDSDPVLSNRIRILAQI